MKRMSSLKISMCQITSIFSDLLSIPSLSLTFVDCINRFSFELMFINERQGRKWNQIIHLEQIRVVDGVLLTKAMASISFQVALSYSCFFFWFSSKYSFLLALSSEAVIVLTVTNPKILYQLLLVFLVNLPQFPCMNVESIFSKSTNPICSPSWWAKHALS